MYTKLNNNIKLRNYCTKQFETFFSYFINHVNRTTTWEYPRVRYWQYSQYVQSQNSMALSSATTITSQDIPMQVSR